MKRGFLNGSKSKLGGTHSKVPLTTATGASRSNPLAHSEQPPSDDQTTPQKPRTGEIDFRMIHRKISFKDFQGVIFTDEKIINLIPERFDTRPSSLENAYRVSSTQKKGAGMFATRAIDVGEVILVENPVVVYPCVMETSSEISRDELFPMLFDQLPLGTRERAYSLWNCKPSHVCGKAEGIVRSNGIEVELPIPEGVDAQETPHSGTFLDISRCNHSCGPNASYYWDLNSYSMSLYATRPIQLDEEISIQYTNLVESREKRRKRLLEMYLFHCECDYCNLPSAEAIAASDAARLEIAKWPTTQFRSPQAWCANLALDDNYLVERLKRIIQLHEQEHIVDMEFASRVGDLSMVYGMLSDETNFVLWGQKTLGVFRMMKAVPDLESLWERLLIEPQRQFPPWGLRAKKKSSRQ